MSDVTKMTNEELADALWAEGDRLLAIGAEVVRTTGRPASTTFAEKDAVYKEAARRLRDSVPRELYDKAWEECKKWRALCGSRDDRCFRAHPIINGMESCVKIDEVRYHDAARAAQGEAR